MGNVETITITKSEYDRLVKTRLDAMHFFGAWQVASSISDKDSMIRVAQQFINKLEENNVLNKRTEDH